MSEVSEVSEGARDLVDALSNAAIAHGWESATDRDAERHAQARQDLLDYISDLEALAGRHCRICGSRLPDHVPGCTFWREDLTTTEETQ